MSIPMFAKDVEEGVVGLERCIAIDNAHHG